MEINFIKKDNIFGCKSRTLCPYKMYGEDGQIIGIYTYECKNCRFFKGLISFDEIYECGIIECSYNKLSSYEYAVEKNGIFVTYKRFLLGLFKKPKLYNFISTDGNIVKISPKFKTLSHLINVNRKYHKEKYRNYILYPCLNNEIINDESGKSELDYYFKYKDKTMVEKYDKIRRIIDSIATKDSCKTIYKLSNKIDYK